MPDRHIFRVDGNGAAEPTGKTAPPEPNRAIARFDRKAAPVAVEAPPRSLRVPEEPAQIATPTRRRGRPRKADSVQLELAQVVPVVALTGSTEAAAPKRRGRPPKVAVAAAAAPAVKAIAAPAKRGPKPKIAAVVEDAPAVKRGRGRPPKVVVAAEAAVPAPAKRGPKPKVVAKKATPDKKAPVATKSAGAKKKATSPAAAPARKKAATLRKKKAT